MTESEGLRFIMLEFFQVTEILLENCKVASCFFLALMLVRPLTEKFFSQSWHYLAFRVNLSLFFLPIRCLSEGIAPLLLKIFPSPRIGEVTLQTELAPNFTITWREQIVGESQQFTQVNSIDWTGLLVSTWYPIWVLVAVVLFLWKTYCFLRFQREVKGLSAIQCPIIQKFFQKCKELMGFTGEIPLLGSENIYSPVLLGLRQPKILLPVKKVQEKHLEYIFTHELTHLRRKDLWWKSLLTPLTILYWWNPLIYLFSWQFETVLEYSCDEEVVKLRSHEERKCYGKAILESIDEEQTNPVLGLHLRKPEQLLETRLIKMLKYKEMKTITKVFSGVLMVAILMGASLQTAENQYEAIRYDDNSVNYIMNQNFHSSTIETYPDLELVKLIDVGVGPADQSNRTFDNAVTLFLTFDGEVLNQDKYTTEEFWSFWLRPAIVTYTDGTVEELILDSNMEHRLYGGISRTDVTTISIFGTEFTLPQENKTSQEATNVKEAVAPEQIDICLAYTFDKLTEETIFADVEYPAEYYEFNSGLVETAISNGTLSETGVSMWNQIVSAKEASIVD